MIFWFLYICICSILAIVTAFIIYKIKRKRRIHPVVKNVLNEYIKQGIIKYKNNCCNQILLDLINDYKNYITRRYMSDSDSDFHQDISDIIKQLKIYDKILLRFWYRHELNNFPILVSDSKCIDSNIFDAINQLKIYDPLSLEIYEEKYYHTEFGIEMTNDIRWWNHIFGHTIPTRDALHTLLNTVDLKHLTTLSVGSGKCLWEYLLQLNGCHIICTDVYMQAIVYTKVIIIYDDIDIYTQLKKKRVIKSIKDIDVLFLGWPEPDDGISYKDDNDVYHYEFNIDDNGICHNSGYDERALKRFKGKYVVMIHDGEMME